MVHPLTAVPLTRTPGRAMGGRQDLPQPATVPKGPVMALRAGAPERRSAATARLTQMAAPAGGVAGATPGTAMQATGGTARSAMAATDRPAMVATILMDWTTPSPGGSVAGCAVTVPAARPATRLTAGDPAAIPPMVIVATAATAAWPVPTS